MSEQEQKGAETAAADPADVGKSITDSFTRRSKRLDVSHTLDGLDSGHRTQASSVPDFAPALDDTTHAEKSSGHLGSVTAVTVTPKKPAAKRSPRLPHQTRKARLRISRVDPWSVMKTALLFGVAGWIIIVVATFVIMTVLDETGLYAAINSTVAQVFAQPGAVDQFDIKDYVNTTRVTALAAAVGGVSVILLTALATVFAFLYNLSANVMGGIEVTLAED
ncbi:MAG: DUF3566 domain-containing protein [Propionibacteriaceae bacterium]|jgi:hypothetical protein|nr:DUF3566 domain-containing protein [Propionibacteriaceae bacterium]